MAGRSSGAGQGRDAGERGFTLLEVLVALAIAAPALALLYRQGVASMGIARNAAAYQEAISRAQSRLDLLADSLDPGERAGDDGGGFQWRTWVAPVASTSIASTSVASTSPARPASQRGGTPAGGVTLYDVAVEVTWSGPGGGRSFALKTRRLGPASAP